MLVTDTTRLTSIILLLVIGCSSSVATDPTTSGSPPPGPDTSTPFPMDRGDDGGQTPGSYKGLPLRLTATGAPSVTAVDGIIGIVCIGMSNANQECGNYQDRVAGEFAPDIAANIRVVNCAVGGHAIERWIDPAFDGKLWDDCRDRKAPQAGIRPDQVRVIWHKAANQFTTGAGGAALPTYPSTSSDYEAFVTHLGDFAARVAGKFPSVQAVYTSSRSYGGFAGNVGRGEPLSYEEGLALNTWLGTHATVDGVWYGWGPYLWAPDCSTGMANASGVCYDREDYVADGVHPSTSGRQKVSQMLHDRFRQEAWYRR